MAPLARQYRVWALDLKGHGDSPLHPGDNYHLEDLVADVVTFIERQGIERLTVAGNSLGGSLALVLAARHPERVSGLILLAPAVIASRLPYIFYPLKLPFVGWLSAAISGPWIIPVALRLAYHDPRLITPEVIDGYGRPFRSLARRLALRKLCQQLRPWPRPQVEALLADIHQPTVIIWGEQDRILPPAQAGWLKNHLPQAELHLLPGVGHAPQEESPARVNEIMIDFLARSS